MKKTLTQIVILSILSFQIYSQCPDVSFEETGNIIASRNFTVSEKEGERDFVLNLKGYAKKASWGSDGSQAAVVTVFIDRQYNQDIILFQGETLHNYQVVLGKIRPGKHTLEIVRNRKRSAPKIGGITINSLEVFPFLSKVNDDLRALSYVPFLSARPDTIERFSDIPILTFYQILTIGKTKTIRFTTIFSNEDGGTQTAALLARWGRTTDIEWVYEIESENETIIAERFQGKNHVTTNFSGDRLFGNHPAIFNVTVNNNFAAAGCSPLRTALLPVKVDLTNKSRETVMDEYPWTYRIMALEAIREGRINSKMMNANTIADLRDYIYAEVYNEPHKASVSIEATSNLGQSRFSSDGGQKSHRVDRPGFTRIALHLPRENRKFPINFSIICHTKNDSSRTGMCKNAKLLRIITLDDNFAPHIKTVSEKPHDLKTGEQAIFKIKFAPAIRLK